MDASAPNSRLQPPLHRWVAGLMLGLVLLLNAAAVLPALHHFWHDASGGGDEHDCAVAAMANGSVDPATPAPALVRPVASALPAPAVPVESPVSADDVAWLPARAPPV